MAIFNTPQTNSTLPLLGGIPVGRGGSKAKSSLPASAPPRRGEQFHHFDNK